MLPLFMQPLQCATFYFTSTLSPFFAPSLLLLDPSLAMQNAKSLANKSCAQSVDINFVSLLLWKLLTDNAQEQCAIITHFFFWGRGRVLKRFGKGKLCSCQNPPLNADIIL